ncbi:MAG: hypothetical protein EOP86_25820, partial [Verrucomicrobiaceae bacterium]
MNRSALKSAGLVLLGVALGCAMGRLRWWSSEAGTDGRLQRSGTQTGADKDQSGGPVGGKDSAGKAGVAFERRRMEQLADKFRHKIRPGNAMAGDVDVITDAAGLSSREFSSLIEHLSEDKAD